MSRASLTMSRNCTALARNLPSGENLTSGWSTSEAGFNADARHAAGVERAVVNLKGSEKSMVVGDRAEERGGE